MTSNPKTTLSHPTPSHAPPVLTSKLQSSLYEALQDANSIPAIQRSLTQELSATGWTANLRVYIMQLLRSGECTTFNEVMERVMKEARNDAIVQNGTNGVTNGASIKSIENGSLKIPERAVKEGIKVVKKELERACEIKFDDEG